MSINTRKVPVIHRGGGGGMGDVSIGLLFFKFDYCDFFYSR